MYHLEVVDVLKMSEDQAMASKLSLLREWVMQAVSDLPLRFWFSETGDVVMSLGQYIGIIEKMLSISREEKCDHTDSIRKMERSVIGK